MAPVICTLIITHIDSKQTQAFHHTCIHRTSRSIIENAGAPVDATPTLASLMRIGPCVFDPPASAQPHGPNSLMPIQRTLQPLLPLPSLHTHTYTLPCVDYRSCTKALVGTCLISKQCPLELCEAGHSLAPP